MPTREVVPFRLTRNIIDPMGPCGTKGAFHRGAVAAMTALRANADALLTILSAVVADPLYKWSVSPSKAGKHRLADKRQEPEIQQGYEGVPVDSRGIGNGDNENAVQAIGRVQRKLQGYDDGIGGQQLGVESQVQQLINVACDPNNLCEMFCGWAPWS